MSRSTKCSNTSETSSDSDSSEHQYQYKPRQPITTNDVFIGSSKPIHKRARSLDANETEDNDEEDLVQNDSSISDDTHHSNPQSIASNETENNDKEDLLQNDSSSSDDTYSSNPESPDLTQTKTNYSVNKSKNNKNSIIIIDDDDYQPNSNTKKTLIISHHIKRKLTQKTLDQYFPSTDTSFQPIINLTENILKTTEIKVVAFNEQVDRFYDIMMVNTSIIIENGNIQLANENFRSPYSTLEIQLLPSTNIQSYKCINFKPSIKITRKALRDIPQISNGLYVDVEGLIVLDKGVLTTTSLYNNEIIRRRLLKIKDETGAINITLWNKKVNKKNIRIRDGKVNHYNGKKIYLFII